MLRPIAKVERLVEAAGGRVIKRDNWGKKRLAYRIKKQDFAIYVYFEIELEGAKVRELEDQNSHRRGDVPPHPGSTRS